MSCLLGPPCCLELIHCGWSGEEGESLIERAAIGRGPPPMGRDKTRGQRGATAGPGGCQRGNPGHWPRTLAYGKSREQRRESWASSRSWDERSGRRGFAVGPVVRRRGNPGCRPRTLACGGGAVNGDGSHGPPPVAEDKRMGWRKPLPASGARRPGTLAPGQMEDDRGGEDRGKEGARAHSIREKKRYAHNQW